MSVRYPKEVFDIQRATNSVLSRISMLDSKNKYQMQLSLAGDIAIYADLV